MSEPQGRVVDTHVQYVWLDEDEQRVSPIHKTLGTAVNWVSEWHENYMRLQDKLQELYALLQTFNTDKERDRYSFTRCSQNIKAAENSNKKLSLTGKQPVELARWVMTTAVVDPNTDEKRLSDLVLESSITNARRMYGS